MNERRSMERVTLLELQTAVSCTAMISTVSGLFGKFLPFKMCTGVWSFSDNNASFGRYIGWVVCLVDRLRTERDQTTS